ncbi:hypothetical protein QQF64_015714 [Cirrhinus molitorella]|uniref:60S ribosomal protein L19 n=1 Tax=Cirrhinus molitorella TaxID=172907 RepID=A0ABR3NVQ7_9TELE
MICREKIRHVLTQTNRQKPHNAQRLSAASHSVGKAHLHMLKTDEWKRRDERRIRRATRHAGSAKYSRERKPNLSSLFKKTQVDGRRSGSGCLKAAMHCGCR